MNFEWNLRLTSTFILFTCTFFISLDAIPLRQSAPCKLIKVSTYSRTLECSVGSNQYLDYRDVRTFTASTNKIKYNVTITCSGGRIYLPWPFQARHVTELNVRNCGVDGFMSEYFNVHGAPSELETLVMENIQTKIEVRNLYSVLTNVKQISKKIECGLSNAKNIKYRNMAYDFSYDMTSSEDMLLLEQMLSTDALKKDFLQTGGDCLFPNLEYLEESGSRSVSSAHFKLVESSFYPKLREYVISNNSLSRVPKELRNMDLMFLPNIERLDLSHNTISELSFVNLKPKENGIQLLVDLRHNVIQSFSPQDLEMLVRSNGIIFDLRGNPLKCSCSLSKYGGYLLGQNSAAALDIYNGMNCWNESNGGRINYVVSDPAFSTTFCKY